MKFFKTLFIGATLVASLGFTLGVKDAFADSAYTIQQGDTLSQISIKFAGDNRLINQIAQDNGITDVNMIYAGQQLVIRTPEEAAAAQPVVQQVEAAPVQEVAVSEPVVATPQVQETTVAAAPANSSSAKEWIAQRESSGSYTATNGRYIGRYQLDSSYLNGDYSAENQERVADAYVAGRYGSWEAAQAFWMANGWY